MNLLTVLIVAALLCGLAALGLAFCSVFAVVDFVRENGWKCSLKVILACTLISGILTGVVYYMPWQGWVAVGLLLVPIAAAGAASHRPPAYLRPGFYGKVFGPPSPWGGKEKEK